MVYFLNTLNGNIERCDFKFENNAVCFDEYMCGCQSSMFYITNEQIECENRDVRIWNIGNADVNIEKIPLEYISFENNMKNVLVLDMCRYSIDDIWSETAEVGKLKVKSEKSWKCVIFIIMDSNKDIVG